MFDRPDPLLYLAAVFPLSMIALGAGYVYAYRHAHFEDEKSGWAFGLGQAAIFGLIALILGFSFAFAAARFETRRGLVVSEADAIRGLYLRAGFLPPKKARQFRTIVVAYTRSRLQTYASVHDVRAEQRAISGGTVLQGELWTMAAGTARRDPRSPFYVDLTRSVIETITTAEEQEAALNNHVPRAILGLILLCTLVGALLLGLTFGRAKAPNAVLAVIFCLLFAATVFTIVDLDHPQGGFISVDVAPLYDVLDQMTGNPSSQLIRSPIAPESAAP